MSPPISPSPPTPPAEVIRQLLGDARGLQTDYSNAFRSYLKTRQWADLVAQALDLDEVPDALFHEWEHTDEYRQLLNRFGMLYDKAANFFRDAVGSSGRSLGSRLARVAEASRLTTRIARLVVTFEVLQADSIGYRKEAPARRRSTSRTAKRTFGREAETKAAAWGIVSALVGIFALSAFIGTLLSGLLYGLAEAILATLVTFLILRVMERKWAPWLTQVLARGRP